MGISDVGARPGNVSLIEAPFRYSPELGYYDTLVSSAGGTERKWFLVVTSTVSFCSFAVIALVFTSVLINRNTRTNPFNMFLLYHMAPDLFFSGSCAIICAINASKPSYASLALCRFQSFALTLGLSASCWVNTAVGIELHRMLRYSFRRKRYFPPTPRMVTFRCIGIYVVCSIISLVSSLNFDNLPVKPILTLGEVTCLPSAYDTKSSLVYYFVFMPSVIGLPTMIVSYIAFDVLRNGYLPPEGKRRMLAVYFFRLVVVFQGFWTPAFLLTVILGGFFGPTVQFAGGVLAHLQGGVSALVSLKKDDVYDCFQQLLLCERKQAEDTERPSEQARFEARASFENLVEEEEMIIEFTDASVAEESKHSAVEGGKHSDSGNSYAEENKDSDVEERNEAPNDEERKHSAVEISDEFGSSFDVSAFL